MTSDLPAQRTIGESERYAGKLIELVLPWNEHRVTPCSSSPTAYGYAAAARAWSTPPSGSWRWSG